jgi:branched-chain amino acid transport system ATP-binding protein
VALGTLLVQVIFLQVPTFLPQVGYTGLIDALQWVLIGVLWLACLAIRPRGLIPERRYRAPAGADAPAASSALVAPVVPSTSSAPFDTAHDGPVLDVRGVSVFFGGVQAVRGVSLQVAAGEVVGLIGPNGAGKSSLLGALGGQFAVASGRVLLGGHDVTSLAPYRRARVGIVRTFQHTSTFDGLTVFENLLVAAVSARGARLREALTGDQRLRAAAAEAVWARLRQFDMVPMANSYGSELSGGQRRLVEIMRCLMESPRVLLLDEPMVGVAPHLVRRIGEDCARISASGVAIVIVEHALEVVEAVCDRVVVMASGRVVAEATYAEAMSSSAVKEAYFA